MARKSSMSGPLTHTIRTKDGACCARGEAAEYMTGLPEQRARYNTWQHAARLLLDGADGEALTAQIENALMLDGYRRFR